MQQCIFQYQIYLFCKVICASPSAMLRKARLQERRNGVDGRSVDSVVAMQGQYFSASEHRPYNLHTLEMNRKNILQTKQINFKISNCYKLKQKRKRKLLLISKKHPYIYIYIYISSSSSRRATSTDKPDPLSPLFPIVHRLW